MRVPGAGRPGGRVRCSAWTPTGPRCGDSEPVLTGSSTSHVAAARCTACWMPNGPRSSSCSRRGPGSTVHRVLAAEGLVLQGPSPREPGIRAPWPEWIDWKPGRVWCYDFTHFTRARRVAVAVMDVVSRRWLATLVSAEETSSQIEAAFIAALDEERLAERIDTRLLAGPLRAGTATAAELDGPDADGVPVLIAMSDNGPQMRSHTTKEFMAACAIMQRF